MRTSCLISLHASHLAQQHIFRGSHVCSKGPWAWSVIRSLGLQLHPPEIPDLPVLWDFPFLIASAA